MLPRSCGYENCTKLENVMKGDFHFANDGQSSAAPFARNDISVRSPKSCFPRLYRET